MRELAVIAVVIGIGIGTVKLVGQAMDEERSERLDAAIKARHEQFVADGIPWPFIFKD